MTPNARTRKLRTGTSLGPQREGMRQHGRAGAQAGLRAQKPPLLAPCHQQRNTFIADTGALTEQQDPRARVPSLQPPQDRGTALGSSRTLWGLLGNMGQRGSAVKVSGPGATYANLGALFTVTCGQELS